MRKGFKIKFKTICNYFSETCSIFQLLLSVFFLLYPFLSKGPTLAILFSDSPGKKKLETQEIFFPG